MQSNPPRLRVLIADDHPFLREGLRRLIESPPSQMEVVHEASDALEAVEKSVLLKPDIAIVDLFMPQGGGLRAVREIRKQCPQMTILILTMHDEPTYVREALEAGADGYVSKRSSSKELLNAIASAAKRRKYIDPSLASSTLELFVPDRRSDQSSVNLSRREEEVLRFLARGFTNREIAQALHVSVKTAETYRTRIGTKLGLKRRSDIVAYAIRNKLLPEE